MTHFYRVTCKHGHCGKGKYKPITFVFLARDAIRAMELAQAMPGVKHSKMILECNEISHAEYINFRKISAYKRMEGI